MKSISSAFLVTLVISAISPAFADDAKNAACDAVAASPIDKTRPAGVAGVPYGEVDSAKARPICEAAAAADPTNARMLYQAGRAIDVGKKDLGKALEYYEKAAALGNLLADNNAGNILWNNDGDVAQNPTAAAKHYIVAANGGVQFSMEILGRLYEMGKGVPQDFAQAKNWFEKGAALGDEDAMDSLGRLYDRGRGVPVDKIVATQWFKKSADAGSAGGQNDYGVSLETGQGVPKNQDEAFKYYKMASDAGAAYGMVNVSEAMFYGHSTSKDQDGAYALFVKAIQDHSNGLADDILEDHGRDFSDTNQIKFIEEMLKWKEQFLGTPDESFDAESYAAIAKIRDAKS